MVVEATVLVVGDEDDRVFPEWPVANSVNHLRNIGLTTLDIGRRVFVVLQGVSGRSKIRVDEGNLRKRTYSGRLRQENWQWQIMNIGGTEAVTLRYILEIIGPGDAVLIQQIKNGSCDRLVAPRRWKAVIGGQMAK